MIRSSVIALFVGVIALTPLQALASDGAPAAAEAEAAPAVAAPAPSAVGTPLVLKPESGAAPRGSSTDLGLATKVGACVLLLGAGVWAFRRRRATSKAEPGAKGALTLLSRLSLGARTEVCVVEVDGQRLVLGITPQSIRTLSVSGLESVLADDAPVVERPQAPRERAVPATAPPRGAETDERVAEDDEPRVSRRDINQTGVQRISRVPHEGLLRLFERTRTLSRGAEAAESEPTHERERRAPREPERNASHEDRPAPRRASDETRPRASTARAAVEGQARGLAAMRSKR